MKKLISIFSVCFLVGCSNMQLYYSATVKTDSGPKDYTYVRSYHINGYAWACGITAILYGGWCWAYLARPFNIDKEIISIQARNELREKYKLQNFEIEDEEVEFQGWRKAPPSSKLEQSNEAKP